MRGEGGRDEVVTTPTENDDGMNVFAGGTAAATASAQVADEAARARLADASLMEATAAAQQAQEAPTVTARAVQERCRLSGFRSRCRVEGVGA